MASTDWKITTDIYDIVDSIEGIKKRYIDDEDETTLALGIYGFITDTEAKKIQTSVVMQGELGNEMFPTRAKLTKNVLTHALYNNISGVNATPAYITLNMAIKDTDFNEHMINTDGKERFVIDKDCPIFVGGYEFHLDYDLIIDRTLNDIDDNIDKYIYSAHYDMSNENILSTILDPYLKQPFKIKIGNDYYIVFQAELRQYSIETTTDKLISDSIIENKTFTFDFDNQMAGFDVYVTDNYNNTTTRVYPTLYGSNPDHENYCWYLYISDSTIRIIFDNKSYIPGLNCDIEVRSYTTLGKSGNFDYKTIDEDSEGEFIDISSSKYNYNKINMFLVAVTNSMNGKDKKSKEELQELIPKAALARGSYTTETDINNYFNIISTDEDRLVMNKKVDNQLSRIWYAHLLLKDELGDIIPTNSINISLNYGKDLIETEDGRYILPAGTIISYDPELKIGTVIDETNIPEPYTEEYYKQYSYMTVYNIIIKKDPLYAAFYLTSSNIDSFFVYNWVNETSQLQFIATKCNFQRNLLVDKSTYKFTFKMAQSISKDYGLYIVDKQKSQTSTGESKDISIITNNMKCIVVFYRDNKVYRWIDCKLDSFDDSNFISSWSLDLQTDNAFDIDNRIKIKDLKIAGTSNSINYGYMEPNTEVKLYILAKFDKEYGRYDLDKIAPGLDSYTVTNIYEINNGFTFYENYTNISDTKVKWSTTLDNYYDIANVPVVGYHYLTDQDHADYLIDAMNNKKSYIEYCMQILENSFGIDFKFFNTYGPSQLYSIGDREGTMIGHVDLCMKFRVSLKSSSDLYTKSEIIEDIKNYIEDLYNTGDFHAPLLTQYINEKFSEQINYIEFMNFNDFWLGVQHIQEIDNDDPHITPEFLNIRNKKNDAGEIVPDIEIETIE